MATENGIFGWHHRLNGHEFEQTQADSMLKPGMLQSMGSQRVGHNLVHVLAIVNTAAMNNGIHVSFSVLVSSGYMPRSAIAESYGGFLPSFLRNLPTIFLP